LFIKADVCRSAANSSEALFWKVCTPDLLLDIFAEAVSRHPWQIMYLLFSSLLVFFGDLKALANSG